MIRTAAVVVTLVVLAGCAPATDNDAAPAPPDCTRVSDEFEYTFRSFDDPYRVTPICAADVGPGLQTLGPEFTATAAGLITNPNAGGDVLRAFVGTLKPKADAMLWMGTFAKQLGPDATHGAIDVEGREVTFIDLRPDGPRGFVYGNGRTVVVAYVVPPLGPPSHPMTPMEVRSVLTQLIETTMPEPVPYNPVHPADIIDEYPLARGTFTVPTDPGWVYFQTDEAATVEAHCGMSPDAHIVGCDVAHPPDYRPPDTNQIILDGSGIHYRHSDTATYTRSGVDVLYAGQRLENGDATCTTLDQVPVFCRIVSEQGPFVKGAFH
jgi:hypothetical protein